MIINPNEYGSLFYDDKEKEYVNNVITQRRIFRYSKCQFPYTSMCEEKIKNLVDMNYCLMTTNGTSGLKAALVGAGVHENDRVIISSYTFLATALAVISLGAIPVPIDIDLNYGLNLKQLKEEIKLGCKAIIAVHFQGRTFDLTKVCEIADNNNIILIEDACQAFASTLHKKHAGTFGKIGVYSFQQFKQISCGEGGCVVTNDRDLFNKMRNYTDMGSVRERFQSWNSSEALFGENYRMNNLNAAVLYAQLEKLDNILLRQKASRINIMKLIEFENIHCILNSNDPNGDTSMNIVFLLNNPIDKDRVISMAKEKNIELRNMWSSLYYDNDLFARNNLSSLALREKECTYTKELIDRMLVISIPPCLSDIDERTIAGFIIDLKNEKIIK